MKTTRTPWNGFGLAVLATGTLALTGCQPAATPPEGTGSYLKADFAAHPPAQPPSPVTDRALPPLAPAEAPRPDPLPADHANDPGVQQAALPADPGDLPPAPTAPAPVIDAAEQELNATAGKIDQGIQQVSGDLQDAARQTADEVRQDVRRRADSLKQDIQQTADQLEQKARTHTQRMTDQFLEKVEQQGEKTLQKGTDRLKEQIRREVAPKP